MTSFIDLLSSIAARPTAYVAGWNTDAVLTYLYGYDQALSDGGSRPSPLEGFAEWVQGRFLVYHEAWGVGRILLHFYGSDRAAIGALPSLYSTFLSDRARLGIAGIVASRDSGITSAFGPFAFGLVVHAPESTSTRPSSEATDLDRWYHEPITAA